MRRKLTIEDMREAIKKAHPSSKWARKVNRFHPNEVVDIYKRLKIQNQI
jgi:hypothetical protein